MEITEKEININGINLHTGLSLALNILALINWSEKTLSQMGVIECCSNCREQMLVLKNYITENMIEVGENRNSDDIVIYYGRTDDFDFQTHLAKDHVWQRAKYLRYDKLQEAADWIQNFLSGSTYYSSTSEEILKTTSIIEKHGWMLEIDKNGRANLNKGNTHIWSIRNGWQCADLLPKESDNNQLHYQNHRAYTTLKNAIVMEDK